MFTKSPGSSSSIDALVCTGGEFKLVGDSLPGEWRGVLRMSYFNSDTGFVFGTHEVPLDGMSPETKSALQTFVNAVEQEFGRRVFDRGYNVTNEVESEEPVNMGMAESNRGLGGR